MRLLANGKLSPSFDDDCPSTREVLTRLGDKWSVLALTNLASGAVRFNELRRLLGGISQRILTRTLRTLERDGLVHRTVHPTTPPRVDYELTALGETLLGPIAAVATWARTQRATIQRPRSKSVIGEPLKSVRVQRR